MAQLVTEDLMVSVGAVRTYAENTDHEIVAALLLEADYDAGLHHEPSIYNYGEIHLGTPVIGNGTLIQFGAGYYFWERAIIENYGLISAVVPAALNARALFAPSWGPDLYNAGRIVAEAKNQAIAYESWDATVVVTNAATGIIEARGSEAPKALFLANSGTVVNHGQILAHAAAGGRDFIADWGIGIHLGPGGGSIFGARIVNTGLIQATDTNSATGRSVAIFLSGNATGTLVNSGTIRGDYAIREQAEPSYPDLTGFVVENSGLIEGRVFLDTGHDLVRNLGQIVGEVSLGIGSDLFYGPAGTIQGTVLGGDGSDMLFGSAAADTLRGDGGDDVVHGAGGADQLGGGAGRDIFVYTSVGDSTEAAFDILTDFASGADRIDLSALAVQSVSIEGGAGFSLLRAVTAAGTLIVRVNGALALPDLILSASPAIGGTANADMLHATAAGSILTGGDGNDTLVGAGGNDRLDGGNGDDLLWGAGGDDAYAVDIRGDVVWEFQGQGRDWVELTYDLATYVMPENVEELIATNQANVRGNSLSNLITGSAGGDSLEGADGNDVLIGGAGGDRLQGDSGSDQMTGGSGPDVFIFRALTDSQAGAPRSDGKKALSDVIADFVSGEDKIDLYDIDADAIAAGQQHFAYIGAGAFTGHAGELRVETSGGWTRILGDVDGDRVADLYITAHTPSIQAADFIL